MAFELDTPTKCKLTDIEVLSQKNRQPDESPGAKLSLEMQVSNAMLAYFDGALKGFLFEKNPGASDAQGKLDIPDGNDMPNLTRIGKSVGALHWSMDLTGYELTIDYGMGGKSNLELEDVLLGNWRLSPKEGGTVQIKFDAECPAVTEKIFGKLATLKSREISVLLVSPESRQADIEQADKPAPRPKGRKGPWPFGDKGKENAPAKSAGEVFAEQHGAH